MDLITNQIGIVGGVGPDPTTDFYLKIIQKYKLLTNGKNPEIVIYSIPVSSEIERKMISGETEGDLVDFVSNKIAQGFELLEYANSLTLVIICNTLTYYAKKKGFKNFLNPVDASVEIVNHWGLKRVAVIATSATLKLKLYQGALEQNNIQCINPEPEDQSVIVSYILSQLKNENNQDLESAVLKILSKLQKDVDAIILGCTDLYRLLDKAKEYHLNLIDSHQILINKTISHVIMQSNKENEIYKNSKNSKLNDAIPYQKWLNLNTYDLELTNLNGSRKEKNILDDIFYWLNNFISKPDLRLGRSGVVCPFVPKAIEEHSIYVYLIPSKIVTIQQLVDCILQASTDFYAPIIANPNSIFKSYLIVFPHLEVEHHLKLKEVAKIAKPILLNQNLAIGEFYPSNQDASIHNPDFLIAQSPYPLFTIRSLASHDKLFFSSKPELLELYNKTFQGKTI